MGTLIRRHPLIAALLAICALLLVVIGLEVGLGTGGTETSASSAAPKVATVDAKLLPALDRTPVEQAFPETAARPLFIPTRRPAPPAAAPAATMVKGQFVLHGVTMVGDVRIAMLKDKSGKTHRIEKGKVLNGVTLAEVEPERVTLRQGDDQEVVVLMVHKASGEAIPPAAAPPGPFPAAPSVAAGQPVPGGAAPPPVTATVTPGGMRPPGAAPVPGAVNPMAPPGAVPAPQPTGARTASGEEIAPTITPEQAMARRRAARGQAQQQ